MVDGNYAVDYGSNRFLGGCGTVTWKNGIITGSDAGFRWKGTYRVENTKLTGEVLASQERDVVNVFGDSDSIQLDLIGKVKDGIIEIIGTRRECADQVFAAVLRRCCGPWNYKISRLYSDR